MYLTPHQKKQLRTLVILLIGIPLTIFAGYEGVQYLTNANLEGTPKEVAISNLTTNSITISWITDKSIDGYIVPILNGSEQSPVRDKRGSGKRYTHYVELKSLEPGTKYSFEIVSDGKKYSDVQENSFEFTTASVGTNTPIPNPIHGSVTGITGDDVLIYTLLKNKSAYPVSTIIPSGGNWIIDLSSFRKISDKSLLTITDDTELILLAKSGKGKGITVEGTYSSLFDSNGKLNELYALDVTETSDLVSFFPEESLLGVELISEEPDDDDEEPVVPPKDDEQDEDENPIVPPKDEEDDDTDEIDEYVIKHDLKWIDLVKSNNLSGLDSGEESVVVTNITDVGFTVVWRSSTKEAGLVKYGTTVNSLTDEAKDVRDGLTTSGTYYSHVVDIERLSPETTYYFKIYSGEDVIDDSGDAYTVKTFATLSSAPPFDTKSGSLEGTEDPSDWVLVSRLVDKDGVGTLEESKYVSTIPDQNGSWILTIGDVRSNDGTQYFSYSTSDEIQVSLLGRLSKIFSYELSDTDITLNVSDLSLTGGGEVKLLDNYGILLAK